MSIGFIGTGNMGLSLATHLIDQEKHIIVFDLNNNATSGLPKKQAQIVNFPLEVAAK